MHAGSGLVASSQQLGRGISSFSRTYPASLCPAVLCQARAGPRLRGWLHQAHPCLCVSGVPVASTWLFVAQRLFFCNQPSSNLSCCYFCCADQRRWPASVVTPPTPSCLGLTSAATPQRRYNDCASVCSSSHALEHCTHVLAIFPLPLLSFAHPLDAKAFNPLPTPGFLCLAGARHLHIQGQEPLDQEGPEGRVGHPHPRLHPCCQARQHLPGAQYNN